MKVELQLKNDYGYSAPGNVTKGVRYALPFYKSKQGEYIHRLRSANQYWRNGKLTHTALTFWCGGHGFMGKGHMYAAIPENGILCATCEGRAIGAGVYEKPIINGRLVKYQPQF